MIRFPPVGEWKTGAFLSRRSQGESYGDIVTVDQLDNQGHLGLQDYGGAIEFRGIKLRELDPAAN